MAGETGAEEMAVLGDEAVQRVAARAGATGEVERVAERAGETGEEERVVGRAGAATMVVSAEGRASREIGPSRRASVDWPTGRRA